jgi:hypothetical protein
VFALQHASSVVDDVHPEVQTLVLLYWPASSPQHAEASISPPIAQYELLPLLHEQATLLVSASVAVPDLSQLPPLSQ